MRDHSDALCQLEPSDAHEAMSRGLFHLDLRRFASVWDDRPQGGPQYKRVGLTLFRIWDPIAQSPSENFVGARFP